MTVLNVPADEDAQRKIVALIFDQAGAFADRGLPRRRGCGSAELCDSGAAIVSAEAPRVRPRPICRAIVDRRSE
jgi:hypothetical protein